MKNTTRNALLIAFLSQKPSKKDAPFVYGLSIICATLILNKRSTYGIIIKFFNQSWSYDFKFFACHRGRG